MAVVRQAIRVDDAGWLELWPSLFIPHAGSHYVQETSVELAHGARFLWSETVAPGRVAFGESWEFDRFESRLQINYASRPLARESYSLSPQSPSIQALRRQFPSACHGTCYAAGAEFPNELLAAIMALHHAQCWVGCTRLDAPAIAIRVVAADNVELTRAMTRARELIHQSFGRPVPPLRRS